MATGLPCRVRTILRTESAAAHAQIMTQLKGNALSSSNIVRHVIGRMLDEPGPATAASIAKVLRLPG